MVVLLNTDCCCLLIFDMFLPVSTESPRHWYEENAFCFDIVTRPNATHRQLNVMKMILICIMTSQHAGYFSLAMKDHFISCLQKNDLDPGSEEVLEWLQFYECWNDEAVAEVDDVEDLDINGAIIWPEDAATQVVCMAIWQPTAAVSLAAKDVYVCPISPLEAQPENTQQVSTPIRCFHFEGNVKNKLECPHNNI